MNIAVSSGCLIQVGTVIDIGRRLSPIARRQTEKGKENHGIKPSYVDFGPTWDEAVEDKAGRLLHTFVKIPGTVRSAMVPCPSIIPAPCRSPNLAAADRVVKG